MDSTKPVKIEGELFWANWMKEYNTRFNEANIKYECTIGNLTDESVEALKELGVQVKNKESMGNYIVAKSKFVFEPVTKDGGAVNIEKIGNGTKCFAVMTSYKHKMSARFGNAPSVRKLVVTELKEYNPEAKVAEEDAAF